MPQNFLTPTDIVDTLRSNFEEMVEKGVDIFKGFDPSKINTQTAKFKNLLQTESLTDFVNLSSSMSLSNFQIVDFYKEFGYSTDSAETLLTKQPSKILKDLDDYLQGDIAAKTTSMICDFVQNPFTSSVKEKEDFLSNLLTSIEEFDIEKAVADFIKRIDAKIQVIVQATLSALDDIVDFIKRQLKNIKDFATLQLQNLQNVPDKVKRTLEKFVDDTVASTEEIFSEENMKTVKSNTLVSFKNAVDQFDVFTTDLSDLLTYQICKTVNEVQVQANEHVERVNSKIQAIPIAHKNLKASSDAALVEPVAAGRFVPTEDFTRISCKEYHDGMRRDDYPRGGGTEAYPQDTGELVDVLMPALIQQESAGDPRARSHKGALGLTQLMPDTAVETARSLGINMDRATLLKKLRDGTPEGNALNIRIGREYLRQQLVRYDNDPYLALAAYNAGPGAVNTWLKTIGDPRTGAITHEEWISSPKMYKETRDYVRKITSKVNIPPKKDDGKPVYAAGKNQAVHGQQSEHWTLADVSTRVTGTPAPITGHNNLRYGRYMSTEELSANMMHLLVNVMDPLAEKYGRNNIIVLSGFRRVDKARALGASKSQHTTGEAVDIRFRGLPFNKYHDRILEILNMVPYDQAIAEYIGYYNGPWLHISITRGSNRGQQLSYIRRSDKSFVTRNPSSGSGYQPGIIDGSHVFTNPKAVIA